MPSAAVTASLQQSGVDQQQQQSGAGVVEATPSSLRVSHSYRTKAEMLNNTTSGIPVSSVAAASSTAHPHPTSATSTVGTAATYLTSTLNNQQPTPTTGAIKSQSAAPIKLASSSAQADASSATPSSNMSQSMQRSELRPRYTPHTLFITTYLTTFIVYYCFLHVFNNRLYRFYSH